MDEKFVIVFKPDHRDRKETKERFDTMLDAIQYINAQCRRRASDEDRYSLPGGTMHLYCNGVSILPPTSINRDVYFPPPKRR